MRANRFLRSHAHALYRHIWQAGLCASTGVASGSDRRSPTVAAATWAAKSICSSPLRSCSSYFGIGTVAVAVGACEVAAEAPPFVELNAPLLEQLECARVANKPALSSTFFRCWEGPRVSRLVLHQHGVLLLLHCATTILVYVSRPRSAFNCDVAQPKCYSHVTAFRPPCSEAPR